MTPEPVHWSYQLISTIFLFADLTIRIGFSVRIIMRKRSHGVSLAWIFVIQIFPIAGAVLYLLFGENRIPEKRIIRANLAHNHYEHWLSTLDNRSPVNWPDLGTELTPLHNLAQNLAGLPAMTGNSVDILSVPDQIIGAIIADVNAAQQFCYFEFYIWQDGGMVDKLTDALIAAAQRGVNCRILLDDLGSRDFLRSETAQKLRDSGIQLQASLPAGFFNAFFARIDIRNHRKIIVIDGTIAYTGSQNMADPVLFKQNAGVGKWMDVMIRLRGPIVECLAGTFLNDWFLESDIEQMDLRALQSDTDRIRLIVDQFGQPQNNIAVQLVPSGPGFTSKAINNLLMSTIFAAREEIILTTPYFIPDEALLTTLSSAALRGVAVSIILPQKSDSVLVEYATRSRFDDLFRDGVRLYLFKDGFLHSKTITVDRKLSLIGSVNLDMRSFWLNFEATLVVYDTPICLELRNLQQSYIQASDPLNEFYLNSRGSFAKFKENAALLIGPLL